MKHSRSNFVRLNPERHGRDETGCCFVCGEDLVPEKVICQKHDNQKIPPGILFIDWVVNHPDFNGVDFDGVYHVPRGAYIYPERPTAEVIYEALRAQDRGP